MFRNRRPASFFFILFGFSLLQVRAGNITLEVASTTKVDRQARTVCTVSVTNKGDEPASHVQIRVESQGRRFTDPQTPDLSPGQTHQAVFPIPTDALSIGRHLLVIYVDYTDTAGFPFTAVSHGNFVLGQDLSPRLQAEVQPIELAEKALVRIHIKNPDNQKRKVEMRLILPSEIATEHPDHILEMGPFQEKEPEFELLNKTASAGSVYQVFTLLQYDEAGIHTGMVVPLSVRIVGTEGMFQRYRTAIILLVALLTALFIGSQFYTRRRTSSHHVPPEESSRRTKGNSPSRRREK